MTFYYGHLNGEKVHPKPQVIDISCDTWGGRKHDVHMFVFKNLSRKFPATCFTKVVFLTTIHSGKLP